MSSGPRAAYIHVPFCRHRCGYCNFTLVARRDDLIDDYLRALELELTRSGPPAEVDTLFFGGGTPTHLPPDKLARLLTIARRQFPLAEGYEFSVEANPRDLDDERVETLAAAGVNRVSMGVQSLDPGKLATLERDHRREQVVEALDRCRVRFHSLAIDLIFGVPGETDSIWDTDLDFALAAAVDHVSTYGLTFERGTAFWSRLERGMLARVDENLEAVRYERAIDRLVDGGFEHYEVSNFARPGHACRHNETYWRGFEYYAAGPGAARYVQGRREVNHRSTTTYLRRIFAGETPVAEAETLDPESRARELLVFGMRRLAGVDRAEFLERSGYSIEELVGGELAPLLERNLLRWHGAELRLTRSGLLVSDSIWPRFLRA